MKVIKFSSQAFTKLCNRAFSGKRRLEEIVKKIVEDVRLYGDEALVKYTRRFDKVKLLPKYFKVTEAETNGAFQNIDAEFISTLKMVISNIEKFYSRQLKKSWRMKDEDGAILGEIYRPIERVGVYIPSGTVPLVSSVYMSVLPARIAGVKKIILVSPPNEQGGINPYILVVANLLKVNEIYKIGGAQAIAALAFGTKTIPRVDKIVGPGNRYVTEAKRQVFGYVDIDMTAGPSEIVIIANQNSNSEFVIADLKAQAEHDKGLPILITTSKSLIKIIRREIESGFIVYVKNLDEAVEAANRLAPEHLEIMVKNPKKILKKISDAGAVFLGPYSPVSVGDYIAGPSHVLPTSGTARFFSGLCVNDFIKSTHFISYSRKNLEKVKGAIEKLTSLEGLPKHAESVRVRFK
ncbi:MAG: histidinol dehydrogenase [Candidatus Omnitrophica bacterium]|nr:histidinol dehydrogenase [Candidatus Omnitrophota bacterium]